MNCKDLTHRLEELAVPAEPEEIRALRAHLESCPDCEPRRGDLELLEAVAELPREIEPSRDLWPQIEQRLQRGQVARPAFWRRRETLGWWAAAAVAILAVALPWLRSSQLDPEPAQRVAAAIEDSDRAAYASIEIAGLERSTRHTLRDVEILLGEAREELSPETVEVLEQSLATIEQALEDVRSAIARDPGNRNLETRLGEIYRQRSGLLRTLQKSPTI